jgi:hypothetical protein
MLQGSLSQFNLLDGDHYSGDNVKKEFNMVRVWDYCDCGDCYQLPSWYKEFERKAPLSLWNVEEELPSPVEHAKFQDGEMVLGEIIIPCDMPKWWAYSDNCWFDDENLEEEESDCVRFALYPSHMVLAQW